MSAPRPSRALLLEEPLRQPDGAGGYTEQWIALGTLWAVVEARTGRLRDAAGATVSATGYRLTIRAAPQGSPARPVPGQRLRDGQRVFAIRSVAEADALGRYLTCFAEEEVTA